MSGILFGLGVLITAIGVAMIGFGVPVREFSFGNTMIIAGTTAMAGGFIVIALAAAVRQLTRIAESLKARPAPRPARPEAAESTAAVAQAPAPPPASAPPVATPRPPPVRAPVPPQPRPEVAAREPRAAEPAPDVSAEAIERLRASIIRPERASAEPSVVAVSEDVPLSPRVPPRPPAPQRNPAPAVAAEAASGGAGPGGETAPAERRKSGLDFLFRSRSAPKRPESFESVWPAESRAAPKAAGKPAAQQPAPPPPAYEPAVPAVTPPAPPPQPPPQPVAAAPATAPSDDGDVAQPAAILKSGVVDGMAYTLYADGSIEATLPQGTVRFGSIAELRSHIEANS